MSLSTDRHGLDFPDQVRSGWVGLVASHFIGYFMSFVVTSGSNLFRNVYSKALNETISMAVNICAF